MSDFSSRCNLAYYCQKNDLSSIRDIFKKFDKSNSKHMDYLCKTDDNGYSFIMISAIYNRIEIIELLLKNRRIHKDFIYKVDNKSQYKNILYYAINTNNISCTVLNYIHVP